MFRKVRSVTSTISAFERKILLFTVPFSMFPPSCRHFILFPLYTRQLNDQRMKVKQFLNNISKTDNYFLP